MIGLLVIGVRILFCATSLGLLVLENFQFFASCVSLQLKIIKARRAFILWLPKDADGEFYAALPSTQAIAGEIILPAVFCRYLPPGSYGQY